MDVDGAEPALEGAGRALTGANWRKLDEIDRAGKAELARYREEYLNRISDLLEDPEFQAEVAAAPGPEPGSEWAIWEAGLKAGRRASTSAGGETSGQNRPPPPASPPPASPQPPAPSPLRDFVPWNERPQEKPYDPMTW